MTEKNTDAIEVLICWHWDPLDPSVPGGIGRFIVDLIRYAPPHFNFTILTMTERKLENHVETMHAVGGKNCRIIPLVTGKPLKKTFLPLRLKYALGIRSYTKSHALKRFVIHYHGIEPFFGLPKGNLNARMLFLHKNPNYRWNIQSESYWRFFPSALYYKIEKPVIEQTEKLFFVNQDCYKDYCVRYSQHQQDMQLISTWVDSESFYYQPDTEQRQRTQTEIKTRLAVKDDSYLILYFGRYDTVKDPLLLIRAMPNILKEFPDTQLIMVGGGKLEDDMKRLVAELNLNSKIKIDTRKSSQEIRELLWAANVSVLPSRDEGMSMAINESLACGCPVVGFEVGEIGRVVTPGESGEIVQERSPEHLASGITAVLAKAEYYRSNPDKVAHGIRDLAPDKVLAPVYQQCESLYSELPS